MSTKRTGPCPRTGYLHTTDCPPNCRMPEGNDPAAAVIRLRDAAPDLLRVCEVVVLRGHAEGCISRGRGNVTRENSCDCLCGPAQAAVAKAKGTAP